MTTEIDIAMGSVEVLSNGDIKIISDCATVTIRTYPSDLLNLFALLAEVIPTDDLIDSIQDYIQD